MLRIHRGAGDAENPGTRGGGRERIAWAPARSPILIEKRYGTEQARSIGALTSCRSRVRVFAKLANLAIPPLPPFPPGPGDKLSVFIWLRRRDRGKPLKTGHLSFFYMKTRALASFVSAFLGVLPVFFCRNLSRIGAKQFTVRSSQFTVASCQSSGISSQFTVLNDPGSIGDFLPDCGTSVFLAVLVPV